TRRRRCGADGGRGRGLAASMSSGVTRWTHRQTVTWSAVRRDQPTQHCRDNRWLAVTDTQHRRLRKALNLPARTPVGGTGIEPVTSSVSGKRSPAELTARLLVRLHALAR